MEVHQHTHTPRKKWTHYFWEFLMLFLAVFCGFLAEYQLEHKIERDRAKELARNLYHELKTDSVVVQEAIKSRFRKKDALQYLIRYFRDSSLTHLPKAFAVNYLIGLQANRSGVFEPQVRSILNQLVNSGSLRYFKSKELQQLAGAISIAIKGLEERHEREFHFINDQIDPFVIKHSDEEFKEKFDTQYSSDMQSLFKRATRYENSDLFIPMKFNKAEMLDKIEDINRLSMFSNLINTQFQYKAYEALNNQLLSALRSEYGIN